ncbi:hypothetical protein PG991_003384 [Apiospora marii]|uniref:Protein kinase domain-containing protein n=1 Tax=Apiospora marii TaxID=335849 RepID=A0ABR1S3H5_9PEZI
MDPSVKSIERLMYPLAAFALADGDNGSRPTSENQAGLDCWDRSSLNPKNRVDSLSPLKNPTWHILGVQADGHRMFAVPTFAIDKPALRVDVYLSEYDDYKISAQLHDVLEPDYALRVKSGEAYRVPLFQHLLRGLESWSSRLENFQERHFELPFGSLIAVGSICANVHEMDFHMIPDYETENSWFSAAKLQEEWSANVEAITCPEVISLEDIHLQDQPHEAISIVTIPRLTDTKQWVFKSILGDVQYMYHELWMLLKMQQHPNIIAMPFRGRRGICGFILELYRTGTLRDLLSAVDLGRRPEPSVGQKLCWSRQIVEAMCHINGACDMFYTGIKHVNIAMSDDNRPIALDFEQRTGRYIWVPPEIYYINYLEYVAESSSIPMQICQQTIRLLKSYLSDWKPGSNAVTSTSAAAGYRFSQAGYSAPWRALSEKEREGAQVYMLGRLLWCIFETVGSVDSGLNIETFREHETDLSFPEFRKTPEGMRCIIEQCTRGAPEWSGRFPSVVKSRGKLWPRGQSGRNGKPWGSVEQTQEAARV